ncbi:hypothetical protein K503DRAFT_453135 [Rhizopogon vinicolor AM-OR11-026]|uniref:Uncharacterized protein n=1 Tax=Rhizopogon vinicolor AM-OR11-026 TaxID=1314800 RepID=A0A1B7MP33_9AGAM|nr:hypothetical protein K503DRAFT_453135 [Rhizopogon vinicolor AM-OR11-026]
MSCAHCPSTLHHRELQMAGSASPFHMGSPRFASQYLARAKQSSLLLVLASGVEEEGAISA